MGSRERLPVCPSRQGRVFRLVPVHIILLFQIEGLTRQTKYDMIAHVCSIVLIVLLAFISQ